MSVDKRNALASLFLAILLHVSFFCLAQVFPVINDENTKTVTFGNSKIRLTLAYDGKAAITSLEINGQKVINDKAGIYSGIRTPEATYSSLHLTSYPKLTVAKNLVVLSGLTYGNMKCSISENWKFTITPNDITFAVERTFLKPVMVEEALFPVFNFDSINTWEGAYQGFGGLAWFYLFNEKLATYGVHTNSSRFWNSKTGNGLTVSVDAPQKAVAMKYTRTADDKLLYSIAVSNQEMIPRFDSGTNRKRFIRQRTDVWAPFRVDAGKTVQHITLSYFDFNEQFGRGKFVGVNGEQVSAVLNTIARIGVIDKKHFGGNSWHTPYGPICLHEQYIAQMGLAINDETYLKGYEECLDFYRDNAIKPDGRVWARWAYNNVDIMPGQVTDKGFYEAQWGFLLDANPDFVTNVAELYDQTGNKAWVKKHQASCEKALDWIINRDRDNDGLVEMMTDSHKEKRGSDWIDIIWASYENAFVNAKLYWALIKWAAVERELGNVPKAKQYEDFAARLKRSFNQSTEEGGFWDKKERCYIHWRDRDNSIHGNNMVTPVNFMAIAYGICDQVDRRNVILDHIEAVMQKEKLFFWPLNLYTYKEGEGNDWQFPFPNYENGDIFLSWGAVGVKAYADYKPELALKYVRNVMARHSVDGLAFQRYGRAKQDGLGDDILAGNSLSVIGLYQAIYGINPMHNRLYLNPHITFELGGTELIYRFREQKLAIGLDTNRYSIANKKFKITDRSHFGFYSHNNELLYFNKDNASPSLVARTEGVSRLVLEIREWNSNGATWQQGTSDKSSGSIFYQINDFNPNAAYKVIIDGINWRSVRADAKGIVTFKCKASNKTEIINITKV